MRGFASSLSSVLLLFFLNACAQSRREDSQPDAAFSCVQGAHSEAVSWDEETVLGVSAREVFEPTRACDAKLTWRAVPGGPALEPRLQETEIAVRVSPRKKSARVITPAQVSSSGCQIALHAQADIRITSADGRLLDQGQTELSYEARGGVFVSFAIESKPGGSLHISPESHEQTALRYEVSFRAGQCAGSVSVSAQASRELAAVGDWSTTGCRLFEEPIPLAASAQAAELADQALQTWSEVSYPGLWDDGSTANLHVSVEREGDFACALTEERLWLPLRVTYGTDDGRIAKHTVRGRALDVLTDETPLRLGASELLSCAPGNGVLAGVEPICGELAHAVVSLRLNKGDDITQSPALQLYEYQGNVTIITPDLPMQAFSLLLE